MYLLLPPETLNSKVEGWRINWRGISSCVGVVDFMKTKSLISSGLCHKQNLSYCNASSEFDLKQKSSKIVYVANCLVDVDDLKDMVVLAIHTRKFYSVVEVVTNTSAECPFNYTGSVVSVSSDYSTYIEYFDKKLVFCDLIFHFMLIIDLISPWS